MEMQNLKVTPFSEFVKQMNELFGDPTNMGGSPNYPAGDFATSDQTPAGANIQMIRKNKKRYVPARK
jgi:hypothetical protein